MNNLTVLDLFCGAGGFSEGFRQLGFQIQYGIDFYQPAISTFNHNFNLNCKPKNILDFNNSIDEIESLPDTDVIIGSPPCVSFSNSNNSGKADKQKGILLTEIFLKIIAVKRFKQNSILKAWYMENVPNSKKYLKKSYSFSDLNLTEWAISNSLDPTSKAIILENNQFEINSADYGSPQKRFRLISGVIVKNNGLQIPPYTNKDSNMSGNLENYLTLEFIRKKLPSPYSQFSKRSISDPLYPWIKINANDLSDHFYDTGLYKCEWEQTKYLKMNHPYMGVMSFPENESKPSRTITATKIGTSREALIFKSEHHRFGDGEFRTPTVREAATLMSFPITFQFNGSEGIKWKLVGNAVCPSVSRAFAKQLCIELGVNVNKYLQTQNTVIKDDICNLNSYKLKDFSNPPKRIKNSPFRRHPFKDGNITVTLSNYDIKKKIKTVKKWKTSVQYGNGDGFPTYNIRNNYYERIESIIQEFSYGKRFIDILKNGFSAKIADANTLQKMHESHTSLGNYLEPSELVHEVANLINSLEIKEEYYQTQKIIFRGKDKVPLKQLFALYAINKISSKANKK